jgi:hypothetical protein
MFPHTMYNGRRLLKNPKTADIFHPVPREAVARLGNEPANEKNAVRKMALKNLNP